ncbi:MAG TPA: histidine triad nucleotide-binding protein [Rickettsiales bacterium]|nr:histidine triad nucleotide-binding protein [Rickettsiales bacterium]
MKYDKNNIFARIIRGEIPCKKIYEDESVLAIEDIAPAAPAHALILPKGEYISFDDFTRNTTPEAIAYFFNTITKIARQLKLEESGYRLITNHGKNASQSVPHFHVHLLGGRALGALLPGDGHER